MSTHSSSILYGGFLPPPVSVPRPSASTTPLSPSAQVVSPSAPSNVVGHSSGVVSPSTPSNVVGHSSGVVTGFPSAPFASPSFMQSAQVVQVDPLHLSRVFYGMEDIFLHPLLM